MTNKEDKRPCSVFESIEESCKEISEMRQNKKPKHNMNELFSKIEKWREEKD